MSTIPDLTDPRYLDEVGFFVWQQEHSMSLFERSYDEERRDWSRILLGEVLDGTGLDVAWLASRTVVTVGCGCTGDITTWPAAAKIGVDPLLALYARLGMLVDDLPGTASSVYLSVGAESIPLTDDSADLVMCRNALDHMLEPPRGLAEMRRILSPDGVFYASVDIGGLPTPDEPNVFTVDGLVATVAEHFDVVGVSTGHGPHSRQRDQSVRLAGRKKPGSERLPDRAEILRAYDERITQLTGWPSWLEDEPTAG